MRRLQQLTQQTTSRSSNMSTTNERLNLAILDDYANIAPSKFSSLTSRLEITTFPETLNAKTPAGLAELISRLKRFQIISTMRERTLFSREVLTELPNLKLLLTTGMRNAAIDMKTCAERGIIVCGTNGQTQAMANATENRTGANATTEHTWALILGIAKGVARDDFVVKNSGWQTGLSFGVAGKTMGLLGLGRLGAECARIAAYGFQMKIIAWSTSLTQEQADAAAEKAGLSKGTYMVVGSKQELFEQADVLSVQYVLSERSKGIVGEKELRGMKKDSLFVNTSRGPLVDEQALLKILKEGRIRGAALDVYDIEPLELDSEWRTTKWGQDGRSEVLLSPHMAYVEEVTMNTWYEETAENVERFLNKEEVKKQIS